MQRFRILLLIFTHEYVPSSLPSPHVELMVAHAEGQDPLVNPQPGGKEHKVRRLLVEGLQEKEIKLANVNRKVSVKLGL